MERIKFIGSSRSSRFLGFPTKLNANAKTFHVYVRNYHNASRAFKSLRANLNFTVMFNETRNSGSPRSRYLNEKQINK